MQARFKGEAIRAGLFENGDKLLNFIVSIEPGNGNLGRF